MGFFAGSWTTTWRVLIHMLVAIRKKLNPVCSYSYFKCSLKLYGFEFPSNFTLLVYVWWYVFCAGAAPPAGTWIWASLLWTSPGSTAAGWRADRSQDGSLRPLDCSMVRAQDGWQGWREEKGEKIVYLALELATFPTCCTISAISNSLQ